jgi:hypothetical protein
MKKVNIMNASLQYIPRFLWQWQETLGDHNFYKLLSATFAFHQWQKWIFLLADIQLCTWCEEPRILSSAAAAKHQYG